jgi:hypothetical protein
MTEYQLPPATGDTQLASAQRLVQGFAQRKTIAWSGSLEQLTMVKELRAVSLLPSLGSGIEERVAQVTVARQRERYSSFQAYYYDDQLFYLACNLKPKWCAVEDPVLGELLGSLVPEIKGGGKLAFHDWLGNQGVLKKRRGQVSLKLLFKYTKAYYLMTALS